MEQTRSNTDHGTTGRTISIRLSETDIAPPHRKFRRHLPPEFISRRSYPKLGEDSLAGGSNLSEPTMFDVSASHNVANKLTRRTVDSNRFSIEAAGRKSTAVDCGETHPNDRLKAYDRTIAYSARGDRYSGRRQPLVAARVESKIEAEIASERPRWGAATREFDARIEEGSGG